jgi:hypothetical protein
MGLAQALNRLDVVASAAHTGAHPTTEQCIAVLVVSRAGGAPPIFRLRVEMAARTFGDGTV